MFSRLCAEGGFGGCVEAEFVCVRGMMDLMDLRSACSKGSKRGLLKFRYVYLFRVK